MPPLAPIQASTNNRKQSPQPPRHTFSGAHRNDRRVALAPSGERRITMSQPSATADRPATSYDDVPYDSLPVAQTHPDRLATVATLFGMRPTPTDRCQVLELGCAAGGNLIPMALALPRSRFLGIDLSGRQVADGQKIVATLGLVNI